MKRQIIFLLILFSTCSIAFAQGNQSYAFQKLYLYTFMKYIEWPNAEVNEKFTIGFVGYSGLYPHLEKMAEEKEIRGKAIELKKISSVEEAQQCQLLYVPSGQADLPNYIEALKGSPVLIVSDLEGAAEEGAGFSFLMVDGKLKFDINTTTIEASQLSIKDALKKFAVNTY
ncbi:YfiR family protein [Persicobacter psychrovividus]|uniref:YfiR family protein n=1 Tax=Persicobacter psychrovividus TaxID=387638 RepID=A0ABN6L894_9BACT|nr:hypothetical protein PEPS_01480 [Persicobacter psychrovividus]